MEKPDEIFYDNREFKVLFRCRQCKFSMYESVAKLPRGEVTIWQSYWQPSRSHFCKITRFLRFDTRTVFHILAKIKLGLLRKESYKIPQLQLFLIKSYVMHIFLIKNISTKHFCQRFLHCRTKGHFDRSR